MYINRTKDSPILYLTMLLFRVASVCHVLHFLSYREYLRYFPADSLWFCAPAPLAYI